MKLKDLVTIVIPCKNEERYIGNLLGDLFRSVEIGDVRIIIADANSTDNTRHIIKEWSRGLNIETIQGEIGRASCRERVSSPV